MNILIDKRSRILVGLIFCLFQFGISQSELQENKKSEQMEGEFLGLRTVCYFVGDLQKAKEWYTRAFEVEPYFDEPFYVGFNIGGYELGLLPEETPTTDKTTSVALYWGVNNIQASYEKLIGNGATANEEPENVGGELMVATVKDPWGNIIGIIYNPHFKLPAE